MAFDQSSMPTDLRPLNVVRNVVDETLIAPSLPTTSGRVSDGYYTGFNQPPRGDVNSPPAMAVYYTDASGMSGFRYMNPSGVVSGQISGWTPCSPSPVGPLPTSASSIGSSGYGYSPDQASRGGGGGAGLGPPSDQASEESRDDSVSGRKVKFLCSFGGKILPRPSDGSLRYVGGQTRIISVKRDVTFPQFVQKMVDTYGQPVVIKYQLPWEDLDALVSVSCADDLDNMMEEYAKLMETSPDGSAKLRLFLFSASELDSTGVLLLGDMHDSGHRYVDAVNGIVEGFGGGLMRKESIASAASTQNSDVSTTEIVEPVTNPDLAAQAHANIFSPRGDYTTSNDNAPRLEASIPVVVPPLSPSTQPEIDREKTIPLQAAGQQQLQGYEMLQTRMNFPPPPSHFMNYGRSEIPPQVVYANPQIFGAPRPALVQPHYHDNGPTMLTQQYIPAVQMTGAPASTHSNMNPSIVQQTAQPRMGPVPTDMGYNNPYPGQVGGYYSWRPVTQQEHVPFTEGWMPHQVVSRAADCYMCQKSLPHAHSDTVVQDQKDTDSTVSDTNPLHHSLHLDDVSRIRAMVTPTQGMMGLGGDVHAPYGAIMGNGPVCHPQGAHYQHFVSPSHPTQELLVSKPVTSDGSPVGNAAYQNQEQYVPETSKDLSGKITGNAYRHDVIRPPFPNHNVDYMKENFQVKPLDIILGRDQSKSPVDHSRKDDTFEQLPPQTLGIETTNAFKVSTPVPPPIQESDYLHPGDPFEGLQSNPTISPGNDPKGDTSRLFIDPFADNIVSSSNVQASISPQYVDDPPRSVILEDPWDMSMRPDFPPPKPTKFNMKRESSAKELHVGDANQNVVHSDGVNPTSEQFQTSKGSAEEQIKHQLQETAEGVASSVLISSVPSNTDFSSQELVTETSCEMEGHNSDAHLQTKMEAFNIKPENANFGFPMSDGMGRLQIIKNSDLEELGELGSGTFGTVYHGKWRGTDVAIKRINERCFTGKSSEQERMRDDFWNEAIKLADLHHPNVVAFYGVVLDGPGGSVATVTEYMVNGSLRTALQKNERNLDKRKRLLIAMDVAFGMEYLHSKNIVHFDLKSDNLLVNLRDPHRPICKVGDLGLSKVKCQTLISGGVRGTLPWMAPELLNGSSSLVSEKVDVFSFGIVLWELLTGEEPYADLHYGAIIGGIVSNTLRPQVPESCDPEWKLLMERCWSAEPSERPNFTDVANELRSMAAKAPSKGQTPVASATTKA